MTAVCLQTDSLERREAHLLECAAHLPSPPEVVLAVVNAIDRDAEGADAVAKLIERDVALTARVLRVANSSYYGMTGRISSVRDALVILGFSAVGNLVVAIGIANRYGAASARHAGLRGFWQHGMLVAASAASLARRCGREEGIAYVGGLLHDIGKLVLASAFPESFRDCLQAGSPTLPAEDALAIERTCFGTDHAALGALLAVRWRYPEAISAALRNHHATGAAGELAGLIRCADRIAHAFALPAADGGALQAGADALFELESGASAPDLIAEIELQAEHSALMLGKAG